MRIRIPHGRLKARGRSRTGASLSGLQEGRRPSSPSSPCWRGAGCSRPSRRSRCGAVSWWRPAVGEESRCAERRAEGADRGRGRSGRRSGCGEGEEGQGPEDGECQTGAAPSSVQEGPASAGLPGPRAASTIPPRRGLQDGTVEHEGGAPAPRALDRAPGWHDPRQGSLPPL